MVNREKVIKGLQCMIQRMVNDYDDEELWCESCGYDHDMCMIDIVSDSIALLKEPVKPKMILHGVDGISYADCPNCGKQINDSDNHHCCESCGQSIKWD